MDYSSGSHYSDNNILDFIDKDTIRAAFSGKVRIVRYEGGGYGKYIKIKYCTQLPNTTIPSFVFYANLPQYVKENYRRFLENKIRDNWSLHGCPINVFIRQK